MKSVLSVFAVAISISPAFAAVEVAPAPSVGFGLPAIGAVILVAFVTFLLTRKKA
jgi:hypothetical protein